eukprot:Skav228135  [mRNA]  locus=scaffold3237:7780:10507:- [translate_table: standard]
MDLSISLFNQTERKCKFVKRFEMEGFNASTVLDLKDYIAKYLEDNMIANNALKEELSAKTNGKQLNESDAVSSGHYEITYESFSVRMTRAIHKWGASEEGQKANREFQKLLADDKPIPSTNIDLTITVKDFRGEDERTFERAFTIKADIEKSPLSMYVEGICENKRFNIIRKTADIDEWKAMWFHNGKPLNHPFNSLDTEGVKDGDEIEVHLVKADDERFQLFHKEAFEKAKKMKEEKEGHFNVVEKACVPTSPPLADVPALSNQPPTPLAPVVPLQNFGEMSLEEMEAMMVRLKEEISNKKQAMKEMDITVHMRQPSGNTFPVVTKSIKSVKQFKEQDLVGLVDADVAGLRLILNTEEMRPLKKLHTYGIGEGSTIDLVISLRGGGDNTMVDAKVFKIVQPLPKDDFITDAMQLYQSSLCDLLDNPKTIMVKEFRGRNLFGIEIGDGITAKLAKKEIALRLQFLAKQKGGSCLIGESDFLLNGLGDNDIIPPSSSSVELLLRLRGGGVRNIHLKQKRDDRLKTMKLKAQASASEAQEKTALVDAKLIAKSEKEMKKLTESLSNEYFSKFVAKMDKDAIVSFYNITDGGKFKLQDNTLSKLAPLFIPFIDELQASIDKTEAMKQAFIDWFDYLYALNFLQDSNRLKWRRVP